MVCIAVNRSNGRIKRQVIKTLVTTYSTVRRLFHANGSVAIKNDNNTLYKYGISAEIV